MKGPASMTIDSEAVKKFWLARGRKSLRHESAANLEEDPQLLKLKVHAEKEMILPRLDLSSDIDILDLGCGNGQWSLRFAPCVRSVTGVDFSESMLAAGRRKASELGLRNIQFVESPVEEYNPDRKWGLIFISGVFIYLNDDQAKKTAKIVSNALADDGYVFLRDAASLLPNRYILDNVWSPALGANYSAIYRTVQEYKDLFSGYGLSCVEDGDMFPQGSPLNKHSETRLRYYQFARYN